MKGGALAKDFGLYMQLGCRLLVIAVTHGPKPGCVEDCKLQPLVSNFSNAKKHHDSFVGSRRSCCDEVSKSTIMPVSRPDFIIERVSRSYESRRSKEIRAAEILVHERRAQDLKIQYGTPDVRSQPQM